MISRQDIWLPDFFRKGWTVKITYLFAEFRGWMLMIENLVRKNRSCRRFNQNNSVDLQTLEGLVNLGRLSASAGNLQPLAYVMSCNVKKK
jgi:hypothetical protein